MDLQELKVPPSRSAMGSGHVAVQGDRNASAAPRQCDTVEGQGSKLVPWALAAAGQAPRTSHAAPPNCDWDQLACTPPGAPVSGVAVPTTNSWIAALRPCATLPTLPRP